MTRDSVMSKSQPCDLLVSWIFGLLMVKVAKGEPFVYGSFGQLRKVLGPMLVANFPILVRSFEEGAGAGFLGMARWRQGGAWRHSCASDAVLNFLLAFACEGPPPKKKKRYFLFVSRLLPPKLFACSWFPQEDLCSWFPCKRRKKGNLPNERHLQLAACAKVT